MRVVIDTSVAVAWYLDEAFSSAARGWQERALRGEVGIVVPALHFLEFGNVLRSYVRRSELTRALAADIYALHLEAPIEIVEPSRADLLTLAFDYEATVYDAALIGLSLMLDCPLVTAERTTTPWVLKLGERALTVK